MRLSRCYPCKKLTRKKIGDGNFHQAILYKSEHTEEVAKLHQCLTKMYNTALEMDGTCTVRHLPIMTDDHGILISLQGEHAIGMGKKSSLVKELGVPTVEVMRAIKLALDEHWLMNPGKVFENIDTSCGEGYIPSLGSIERK